MTGKVHQAIGVATAFVMASKFPTIAKHLGGGVFPIICAVAASPGSFLPDIDHQQSHYGRKVQAVSKHLKHRGITHTLLIPTLVFVAYIFVIAPAVPMGVVARVVRSVFYGFEVGYLAHLLADMFNGAGIPLLWPIIKDHVSIMDLDSSGWQCILFCIVWIGGLVVLWILNM